MTLCTLLILIYLCYSFKCSPGCIGGCEADNTCRGGCSENYFNDTSCLYCKWTDPNDDVYETFIPNGTYCMKTTNIIIKKSWLPEQKDIESITTGSTVTFTINENSMADTSFCYYRQKYRLGKWFKLDMSSIYTDTLSINIAKNYESSAFLSIDITNSQSDAYTGNCLAHASLNETNFETNMLVPILNPIYSSSTKKDENFYYIFINVKEYKVVTVSLTIQPVNGKTGVSRFNLTQDIADSLANDLSKNMYVYFSVEQYGIVCYPVCIPNIIMKIILFEIEFDGDYSILIDTRGADRVNYIQEFDYIVNESGYRYTKCLNVWTGTPHGVFADEEPNGVFVRIEGKANTKRYFGIMSEEQRINLNVEVRAICPKNCNAETGNGNCLPQEKKCVCNDSFGGDDCHKLCYYNGKWQVNDYSSLCYFNTSHCDQFCKCEPGYSLVNNYCVSNECKNGKLGSGDECIQNSEGCLPNCRCDSSSGWKLSKQKGKCVNVLCGNGIIDSLYMKDTFLRKEECDNGTNCNSFCQCIDGHTPDPDDPTSCIDTKISGGAIAGIVIGGTVGLILILIFFIVLLIFVLRYKKVDINIYKIQQPVYYYYIHGSTTSAPSKTARYMIDPIDLDYGNDTTATAIMDTRFERMEVNNYSRNKWMMIIFHTPNNPKYVFYFEPQVLLIRPHSTPKLLTSYMTLHCTTKIRDMKIPYTVWFSKSKSTLESIANLLKDKSFETWTPEDQAQMDKLCKNVRRHCHYHITIKTDAASSTHIDMDELNMSEKPIAEGAMGKVYIGSYRSVPVAVKQFRWESLSDEEMSELKKEVIAECEMMSKLRNPFIANYMGSVTYIPQVSMIIQFFVLGSLGEYLRKEKEDYVKLPYKLKVRMLFDTARGMQFLHENRIMHLDLKPDNLLVNSLYTDSACCIKITDFGTSRFTKKNNKNSEDKGLGTPIYAAPETYHDEYTNAGDVYSYAISAWELFYQEEPYKEFKSLFEIKDYVESGKRLGFDTSIPMLLKGLIQDCWKQNVGERPSFEQVCKRLVKLDEDAINHLELDNDVSDGRIEEIINNRTQRMQDQLNEISHD
ncbi:serine-threonine protein kinase, putative [Entamoeba dispar SAW760]|uniref:Serine-threonine protein kinase, putative n=1 Tax=Entamoeba dispar (strain ATCC PRA-260 / SAW760) TaxID=370354 RepID=B0ELR7_ENTDS|nr:serine-threonine protein kinase, putative [Entamoeba dispar SAW760]EDR24510.1 serine-threonine protein kinase, putative [Entamoeba dispar SAW760]|eukprot:EDR24510.1 serine-threonine protein kinase, putative [Entamoeba dispar SAW760]